MTTPFLFVPVFRAFDPAGLPLAGGLLYTYAAGTTTPKLTFSDAAGVNPNPNPVVLDVTGSATVRLEPGDYHFVLTDSTGTTTIWDEDDYTAPFLTAADIGEILFGQQQDETLLANAAYPVGNVLRYGIIPNDATLAGANTLALKTLLSPANGYSGRIYFPNLTGADTYYFNGVIPCADGVELDLQGCTLSYTGAAVPADVNSGLFLALRDFTIHDGSITVAVDNTLASGSGHALYFGARGTDSGYFTVFDAALTVPLGNITVRNLRIKINNTGTHMAGQGAIGMTGGIRNLITDNLVIDGSGTAPFGILYEFGWATSPASTATTQTSHASGLYFRNSTVTNLATTGVTDGAYIELTGCHNCTIDGLDGHGGAWFGVEYRPGEALNYNPMPVDANVAKRGIILRNVVCQDVASIGATLQGAESNAGGYLSGTSLTAAQMSGLMDFHLENCSFSGLTCVGLSVSGSIYASKCKFAGISTSGNVIVYDECIRAHFVQCDILGQTGGGIGVRANFGAALGASTWSPQRKKSLIFEGCMIAGNTGAGIALGNTQAAKILNCRLGYNAAYDGAGAESLQTNGVSVDATASGVSCEGNFVTTSGGATAYSLTGTGPRGCNILNPLGTATVTGTWDFNYVSTASTTQLQDKTSGVNVALKFLGKQCYNTTSTKMFIAQGPAATDTWISSDAVTTLTPV